MQRYLGILEASKCAALAPALARVTRRVANFSSAKRVPSYRFAEVPWTFSQRTDSFGVERFGTLSRLVAAWGAVGPAGPGWLVLFPSEVAKRRFAMTYSLLRQNYRAGASTRCRFISLNLECGADHVWSFVDVLWLALTVHCRGPRSCSTVAKHFSAPTLFMY